MVKLGWMADQHIHHDQSNSQPGAWDFVDDYNKLLSEHGVEDIYMPGDIVHGRPKGMVPHTQPEDYEAFWSLINSTNDPDALKAVVPGNHEAPLSLFLDSDERCVLRERFDYPDDDVMVLAVNTAATGYVTGNPGSGNNTGVGVVTQRLPYADIKWMERQLEDAGEDVAKLILPHAATYFAPSGSYAAQGDDGQINENTAYWITPNYRQIHETVRQFNNVVIPFSHLYQHDTSNEDSYRVDGVRYVTTQHYYNAGSDEMTTYGVIDIDGDGCTINTYEHDGSDDYTPLSASFGLPEYLPDGTASHWLLDSAGEFAPDSIGSNNLTHYGPSFTAGDGAGGGHLSLGGDGDYSEGEEAPVTGSQNRTLAAWVRPTDTSSDGVLYDWGGNATASRWTFYVTRDESTQGLRIEINGDGESADLIPSADQWQLVACTLDGDTMGDHTLYLDGTTYNTTGSMSVDTNAYSPLNIGHRLSGDRYFIGDIGEMLFADRALTVAELDDYRSQTASHYGL